ncbi:MAG: alpha-L-glutamate ligase-like protein [Candidatus Dadabacteria bacterium]|nr:MAG: alpha-L-glutamate ligase-like protein [Candidatus Dadabacteria bacterium]
MFGFLTGLKKQGILGINNRNANYVLRYNQRKYYPRVDDKLITKELATKAGIAVPELYGVIKAVGQIKFIENLIKDLNSFVVKPAKGSGGEGVLVLERTKKGTLRKPGGKVIDISDLQYHISRILSGVFSLGGHPDMALLEYRVNFDPLFENVSFLGVPDIRIVVFRGVPVMSMVRLPTSTSDGKANLHQGAIGAGIDIRTGKTLGAVWRNQIVEEHPDTGNDIVDLKIPHWQDLLLLAARCYELTGLGYQGVDIVIDRDLGPLILEVNARPGLNIQIANGTGLLPRLEKVESAFMNDVPTPDKRVEFALEHL